MGCLTVTYTRLGGVIVGAERVGEISCSASRIGGMSATAERVGGIGASMERKGGISCRFSLICSTGVVPPYLEINPEIIWVFTDWSAQNDVYSNTHWNVD